MLEDQENSSGTRVREEMKIIEETKQNIQHQKDENLLLEDRLRTYKEQLAEKSSVVKST